MKTYNISNSNINGLVDAINSNDIELTSAYLKDIYTEIFDNTNAITGDELDEITARIDLAADGGYSSVNREIDALTRFCDVNNIYIPYTEDSFSEEILLEEDGWDPEISNNINIKCFSELLNELSSGKRGSSTSCSTYEELIEYIQSLCKNLIAYTDKLKDKYCDNEYDVDYTDDELEVEFEESLQEKELSKKANSISKIFVDNKDKINNTYTKEELIAVVRELLKDLPAERTQKIFDVLNKKKNHIQCLQYIYDFILKGDDLGVIKEECIDTTESGIEYIPDDIDELNLYDDGELEDYTPSHLQSSDIKKEVDREEVNIINNLADDSFEYDDIDTLTVS